MLSHIYNEEGKLVVDINNPLYFCYWLQNYLASGGTDLEQISKLVEVPIRNHKEKGEKNGDN
jgi:hypothetical protein